MKAARSVSRRCATALVLLFSGAAQAGPDDKSIQNAVSELGQFLAAQQQALFVLNDVIVRPKEQPKEGPSGSKTPPKPAPAAPPEALESLQFAQQKVAQAQQALVEARQAPNSAASAVALRDALAKAEEAKGWQRRAEEAVRQAPAVESATVAAGAEESFRLFPDWRGPTYRAAKGISEGERGFENKDQKDLQLSGNDDSFSDPSGYDSETMVLITKDGRRIDVAPLVEASKRALPELASAQPFVPVPAQGSAAGPSFQMDPRILRAVLDPEKKKQLEEVGGVALAVTFDMLAYAGVSGFGDFHEAVLVDSPVLVSLGRLQEMAQRYADSPGSWDGLPDELRHPGSIERICGVVLDPAHKDAFLVGIRARDPSDRIDIDELILAFATVWKSGRIPAVSLDPIPPRFGGPQMSRVIAIPFDSIPAKIMLDADYAMKGIMMGLTKALPGVAEINLKYARAAISRAAPSGAPTIARRFWLVPAPLTGGDVHQSQSRRCRLFATSVVCRTENMDPAAWKGLGHSDEWGDELARQFTESYGSFERSPEIAPKHDFLRLHGLVDAVTACALLRESGSDYQVLDRFAALPVRRLSGDDAVPPEFPGLHTTVFSDAAGVFTLVGGAEMRVRMFRSSLQRYRDSVMASLERTVDTFARDGSCAIASPVVFSLAPARVEAARLGEIDEWYRKGQEALAGGNLAEANARFLETVREEPGYSDGWLGLARTLVGLGDTERAGEALARAMNGQLTDAIPLFEMREWVAATHPRLDGPFAVRRLCDLITASAWQEAVGQHPERAADLATFGIDLIDPDPRLYAVRSICWDQLSQPELADKDRGEAMGRLSRELAGHEEQDLREELTFVQKLEVVARMEKLQEEMPQSISGSGDWTERHPDEVKEIEAQLRGIQILILQIKDYAEPSGSLLSLELILNAESELLLSARGQPIHLESDLAGARDLVVRYPKLPDARFALASVIMVQLGDYSRSSGEPLEKVLAEIAAPGESEPRRLSDAIVAELSEAVALDPSYGQAYLARALYNGARHEPAKALEDLRRAQAVLPKLPAGLEDALHAMNPGHNE